MDLKYEHASILGKKMSSFATVTMEILNFFCVSLLMGHPVVEKTLQRTDEYIPGYSIYYEL